MNEHASDGAAVLQADLLPGAAPIVRTINSVPPLRRIAVGWFACPNPDNIRIAGRDRDCTDRLHRLLVENGIKGHAVIARLKQATSRKPDEKHCRIARINRDIGNATAHRRGPNRPRFEIFE